MHTIPRRPEPTAPASGYLARLVAGGLLLELLFVVLYINGGYLDWYPSRLGAPAAWIEDHILSLARPFLVGPDGKLSLVAGQAYLATLGLLFAVYGAALFGAARVPNPDRRALWLVTGFGGVFAVSLLLQPYLASQDIFSYALYARILGLYGQNPYVDVPRDFPFDPLLEAIFWKDQPSNYGPIWIYLSAFVARLTGPDVALTLAALKALPAAFAIAGTPLVWSILGRVSPRDRLVGTVLYAWNPLLVVETSGNGHNDSVMSFFLLLGVWLYVRGRPLPAMAALVVSALTKYVALALVPLFGIVQLRNARTTPERIKVVASNGLLGAALVVVTFFPVYAGPATFQVVSFGSNPVAYTNSPLELIFRELRVAFGESREVANIPLRYRGAWVENRIPTVFWSNPDDPKATGISLPAETALLIVAPQKGRWVHVYEPWSDRFGYVHADLVSLTPPPSNVGPSGATLAVLEDASRSPSAQTANLVLRGVATAIFAAVFFRLFFATRTVLAAVRGSLVLLFLSYWLIETWFWPWYLIWALALAALLPRSPWTYLTLGFSLTVLVLNAQATVEMVPFLAVAYEYRSILIFGPPLVGAVGWVLYGKLARAQALWARGIAQSIANVAGWRPSLETRRSLLTGAGLVAPVIATVLVASSIRAAVPMVESSAAARSSSTFLAWQTEYQEGLKLMRAEEYSRAADALTRAARIRPDISATYRSRFVAFMHTRRYELAIADLDRVLTADGEELDLLLARGEAYTHRQRFDLALQDFRRATALDSFDPRGLRGQARVLSQQGFFDEALEAQLLAISLDPSHAVLYQELGDIYAGKGEYERALAIYDRALALDDARAGVYASRAAALKILGRPEDSAQALQRVLMLSNDADERLWAQRSLAAILPSTAGN